MGLGNGGKFATGLQAFAVDSVSAGAASAEGSDRVIDVWKASADDVTSDEDEDGIPRPKLGSGRLGWGAAGHISSGVERRPFYDGAGLCSPGAGSRSSAVKIHSAGGCMTS